LRLEPIGSAIGGLLDIFWMSLERGGVSAMNEQGQLEAVVGQFRRQLGGFIRNRVPDDATADELTQEVWLRVVKKLGNLREVEKLEPWLYQIARNVVTDFHRRHRPHEELPEEIPATEDEREIETLRGQLNDYIKGVVHSLAEPHREALRLTLYEGLSQVELAERLGLSVTAAKSRVQRARAEVRKTMEQCCRWEFDRFGNAVECEPRPQGGCEQC